VGYNGEIVQLHYLGNQEFSYYTTGDGPQLLIHAGTHGDEYGVIEHVTAAVEKYEKVLPPFVYVPRVSPSAVAAKTRENGRGKDLNRIFTKESSDEEVQWNIQVFERGPFELIVSFHEDPGWNKYYIYDTGETKQSTKLVRGHNAFLKKKGIELLNGVDDPEDIDLGYEFVDGYRRFAHNGEPDNGMITIYAMNRGLVKHSLIPEIPGVASKDNKRLIVESLFEKVLVPYFQE